MSKNIQHLLLKSKFFNMDDMEDQVTQIPGVHKWIDDSPIRFEIMKEGMKRGKGGLGSGMANIMVPTMLGIMRSLKSLKRNPNQPNVNISHDLLSELKSYLLGLGASSVGYTPVPDRFIFKNKAILHDNAIVMSMEMDKNRINTAPSKPAKAAVFEIYRDLGQIANKGADFLRNNGYSAHAGHPLMGLALYPPLAQMAGLGWLGANGLIITPEHGPRVRLATIFTGIENLPISGQNEHQWVSDYCKTCMLCVNKCPPEAILHNPIQHDNGQISYITNERCFPFFSDNFGCSVCIKVCPFNQTDYQKLRNIHFKHSK